MEPIYARLRKRALQIVSSLPQPAFYVDFPQANELSRQFFDQDPVVTKLRSCVARQIEDDFGHGLDHATKVTLDAGALMFIEASLAGYPDEINDRMILLVQCAGLLHDLKRKDDNHSAKGADFAKDLLKDYPFSPDEVHCICSAIRNHEAFKSTVEISTPEGILVSDCLYDADKFRWGPDNFTHTVWKMASYFKTPISEFVERYPKGIKGLSRIKDTFRTSTGKKYGPQFIDLGLAIGNELYKVIKAEFASDL